MDSPHPSKTKTSPQKRTGPGTRWFGPALMLCALIFFFITVFWLIERNTYKHKRNEITNDAESIGDSIRLQLNGNRDYLLMLAKERGDGAIDGTSFQERASRYVADHPEMINITWVDAEYLIRDVAPLAPNRQIVGLRLNLAEPKRVSRLARERRQPVYTRPFEAIQGSPSFEIWVPVFQGDVFLGLFGGVYSCERTLRHLVSSHMSKIYPIALEDASGKILWELPETGSVDKRLIHRVFLTPPESGVQLRFMGYGRGVTEWSLLLLEMLCLAFVLAMAWAMWGLKREIEVRRWTEVELRKSETLYRSVLNAMGEGMCLQTADGEISAVNPAAEKIEGRSCEQILGRNPDYSHSSAIYEDGRPFPSELHPSIATLRNGEPQTDVVMGIHKPDGSLTWISVNSQPLIAEGESCPYAVVTTFHDITERRQAEEELKKKNADMEQFIYTVSHDLRSPLVTVKTFLGFLESDMAEGDQKRVVQDLQYINGAADKMKLLLDELLELSRIDRVETPPVRVSFKVLVAEVLDTLAGAINTQEVDVRLPDSDMMLFGDRPRLCQIWQNLIENAVKYSRDDRISRIELGVRERDGETVFFVKDNGIGIDSQYHGKIFGIFEKLDPKSPGAGLGLSMVQRIVEKCGGRVWVESEGSGQGACFLFTLPRAVVQR